jgi:uncharacterized protein (DUF1501 family)
MDIVTRRKFLTASGVIGGTALAGGAFFSLNDIMATAGAPTRGPADRTLVLLTLYGGNDGLATVIPFADPAYHDARPGMAYPAEQVQQLDAQTGLNPAMQGFKALYDRKQLAIVRGVGYPKPDHSHFRSMDIWQTANPVRPAATGWLGRWLDGAGRDPRKAISLESVLPPVLAGATCAGAAVSMNGISLPKPFKNSDLRALSVPAANETQMQARAAGCFADLMNIDQLVSDAQDAYDEANPDGATRTGGAQTALRGQFDLVAKCVEAGVMTRVFSVSQGGFDFHAGEKGGEEYQLKVVDQAVTGFLDRMARTEGGRKVVVVIYSEFGRRVRANASDGTDHGTASNVLIAGTPVAGGRLIGDQPSLKDLDDGDLKFHTDFRDIYAAVLAEVLDSDPEQALEGWRTRMSGLFMA